MVWYNKSTVGIVWYGMVWYDAVLVHQVLCYTGYVAENRRLRAGISQSTMQYNTIQTVQNTIQSNATPYRVSYCTLSLKPYACYRVHEYKRSWNSIRFATPIVFIPPDHHTISIMTVTKALFSSCVAEAKN